MVVTPAKSDGGHTYCLKCYYVKRGSFKKVKASEFIRLKRKNSALNVKFLGDLLIAVILRTKKMFFFQALTLTM